MAQHIGNIKVKGLGKKKPKLSCDDCILPFFQDSKTLKNIDDRRKFIDGVELLVRKNIVYTQFKAYLMNEKGLNYCQIHPNIKSDDPTNKLTKNIIEMHHGPLLTLSNITEIILNALIKRGYKGITTFTVAKLVLNEHRLHNVQVVMLCKNCHDIFHAGGWIYINPKQAWGNLDNFIKRWYDGFDENLIKALNKNLKIAREYESNDNGILDPTAGMSWKDSLKNLK